MKTRHFYLTLKQPFSIQSLKETMKKHNDLKPFFIVLVLFSTTAQPTFSKGPIKSFISLLIKTESTNAVPSAAPNALTHKPHTKCACRGYGKKF